MGFLSSLFGSSKSKPATTTNIVQQKLAPEIAPFATEVLEDAQALYKSQMEQGYDPYTGQTIAPFTPEQERAMAGIAGLVGTSRPLQEEALETYRRGGDQFTPEVAKQFMSPYQRAVTDIEKRQSQENFEANVMPQFEAKAVGAGGMSGLGTRAGIQAAELQRGQSQLLADIEARGQQKAFEDARKGFEQQQARERQMAGDVAGLGPAMIATGLQEQGALQSVGEQKQQLGQSVMDESYFKFLEEQQFPQQQLANYSGFVYGNPAAGLVNQTGSGTQSQYQPSFGQNILGIGSMLGSAALRNPNMFAVPKGKTGGGIAGLVKRQTGEQVGSGGFLNSPFIQDIKDVDEALAPAARSVRRGLSNIAGYPADVARVLSNYFAGTNIKPSEMGSEDLKGMLNAGPTKDETITKELTLQDREAGNPELEVDIEEIKEAQLKEKSAPQKEATKVIQSLSTQPKALTNKQSAALDEKEAGKKYDNNPSAFGDLTRKQYLDDTKAQNKKYLAFVNKMYPEGQNEFLADALAALGSMFIAENKGEAFQKTFSELQAAGVKRRDARRIAIGKVGLENLKRDDATLEKIRMLPKRRREAIEKILNKKYAAEERVDKKKLREAQIGQIDADRDLKLAKAATEGVLKPKDAKIWSSTDQVENQTRIKEDIFNKAVLVINKDPSRLAVSLGLPQDYPAEDLKTYVQEIYSDPKFSRAVSDLAGAYIKNPGKGKIGNRTEALNKAALTLLPRWSYNDGGWFGSEEVKLREFK